MKVIERWRRYQSYSGIVLFLLLLAAISLYQWILISGETAPPGSDGGNWLAFSEALFGENVRAADAVYPPVFPLLLRFMLLSLSPLTALKVLGLIVSACVCIPIYLLLRTSVKPWQAAILAAFVALIDYQAEMLAWGGYPQLLGVAFVLFSIHFLLRGLYEGRAVFIAASAFCGSLAVATHTLAALQLVTAVGIVLIIHIYRRWRARAQLSMRPLIRQILFWVILTIILIIPVIPTYVSTVSLLAGSPLNPQEFSLLQAFFNFSSWHREYYIWLAVAIVGSIFMLRAVFKWGQFMLAEAVFALGITSLLGLVLSEIRSLHLMEIGLLLSIGVVIRLVSAMELRRFIKARRHVLHYLAVITVVVLIFVVIWFGGRRAHLAFSWYRVVDSDILAALDWARDNRDPGDVAIANETPQGGILGWWVEGYAEIPAYFAVDDRWLVFRDEKEQAEVAHNILSTDAASVEMTPSEISAMVEEHGIRFLILHKETLDIPYENLAEAGFVTGFENDEMVVLTYGGE